jgi:hypothetical protein
MIEAGEIALIVHFDNEGIERPYGWSTVDTREGKSRLKGRKDVPAGTNALVIERVEIELEDRFHHDQPGRRIYYWCMSPAGRLMIDSRFVEKV